MKQTDWKIIYTHYEGPEKRAVNFLSKEAGNLLIREPNVYRIYVLPCEKEGCELSKNAIFVGCYQNSAAIQKLVAPTEIPLSGYLVKVIPNPQDPDGRFVILTANTPTDVFYAAVSFIDDYLPSHTKMSGSNYMPDLVFDDPLQVCSYTAAPDHKTRSIFTWGHSISDFRAYIDNMARLRFNELILWNDYLPINISDVIDYAHSYGISVNLGYSWGWTTHQCSGITDISDAALIRMKDHILHQFREEYAPTNCDGIYFQSFTEREDKYIGGRRIAEAVTALVNMTAGEILESYPAMKLQFGLHATSVVNDLDEIAKVDPRVEILWEDCGEFPYGYEAFVVDEKRFENTLSLTKKLLELRGGAGVGLVFKGVMMLDWTKFFSQHGHYVMGENHREIAAHDRHIRAKGWRMFSAQWMQSGQRVAQILQYIQDHKLSQVDMCLAGTFDGGIYLPMALCAQLYWDCREDYPELLKRVTNRPCITVD